MALFSVRGRAFNPQIRDQSPLNWRRGFFRIWLLLSAAWIMAWAIDLVLWHLRFGIEPQELAGIPVLFLGPPLALLIFGVGAGWAFRRFKAAEVGASNVSTFRQTRRRRGW